MNNNLTTYLEHFLAENMNDIRTIRSLSESESVEKSKYLLDNMIAFVMKKSTALDYDAIEMSKGNIKNLKEYETLRNTIKALQSLKRQVGSPCKEVDTLEVALQNIENLAGNFEVGFKLDNKSIKMMYNNLVVALIAGTSFVISTHIEYIKDDSGTYNTVFKRVNKVSNGYSILFIKNLELFNKKYASGEVQKYLNLSLDKRAFAGVSLMSAGVIVMVGLGIIPLLREIVYQYYYLRTSLADQLRQQANFLLINQNNLKHNSKEAKNQAEVANKLIKYSDIIDVDLKVSSKKASSNIVEENRTLHLDKPTKTTSMTLDTYNDISANSLLI